MTKLKQMLVICLLLISLGSYAYAYQLPDLGNSSVTALTTSEQQKLIKMFKQEVLNHIPTLDDAIVKDYIKTLGEKLVVHTDHQDQKFHFFVVDDSTINAFAGPGGYIGVNSGLILATTSESELAAVLSHEIAHITQHHLERTIEQAKGLSIPTAIAMLAAVALGTAAKSESSADAAAGVAMATMAGGTQHMLNFTRENEAEADNIGMQTLFNSGFDPQAMPNFFARMKNLTIDYGTTPPPFLLTHPVTNKRIAEAENRVSQYPKRKVKSSVHYYLINARLRALTKLDAIDYFNSQPKSSAHQNASQYGYAVALLNNNQYQTAADITKKLIKKYPNEVLYKMLNAQIQTANNNLSSALSILEKARFQHPGYYPLILQYAQTLIDNKQFDLAKNLLETQLTKHSNDVILYNLLAKADAKSGNLKAAYRTRAKLLRIEGYDKPAKILEIKANNNTKLN